MGRFARMADQGYSVTLDEIHDIVGNDDHVIALVKITAAGPSTNASSSSVWTMHVRDGKATEFWAHTQDQAAIDHVMS